MPHALQIVSPGAALDGDFTHQTRFHKSADCYKSCLEERGSTRFTACKDFRSRGCGCGDGAALRRMAFLMDHKGIHGCGNLCSRESRGSALFEGTTITICGIW